MEGTKDVVQMVICTASLTEASDYLAKVISLVDLGMC